MTADPAAPDGDPAADVVRRLQDRGLTLATAESLTGGRVAAAVTAVPGSSACFVGGVVAYATTVKESVLGVPIRAVVPFDRRISRAADAGLLATRVPGDLARALRRVA